jgi:uncharacterized protein DUF397
MNWVRASMCEATGCVEVAFNGSEIRVRNSHVPLESVWFTHAEWSVFVDAIVRGEFAAVDPGDPV